MVIHAVVDRIENGHAILITQEAGIEISIPLDTLEGPFSEGDSLTVTLRKGNGED